MIEIIEKTETDDGWEFEVEIEGNSRHIRLSREYYEELTGGEVSTEELIKASFEFLLERESVGSILPEFSLPLITHYFPEFESVMRSRFGVDQT